MANPFSTTHEIITFVASTPGPKLLVFGAIHGDERCGPPAIHAVIKDLQKGKCKLLKGSVTFVPVCNPAAYAKNKRYAVKNLNRVIAPNDAPKLYEEKLAQNLVNLINDCDYLLDLHAYPTKGPAFAFQDSDAPKTAAFVQALGFAFVIKGWDALYATPEGATLTAGDTIAYAHQKGKFGAVVECGSYKDPKAVGVAYQTIRNALSHLGLIAAKPKKAKGKRTIVTGTQVIVKKAPGKFVKEWKHLDPLKKGEPVALYQNGETICAPADGYIMLPNPKVARGEEWFYFAV